MEDLEGSGTSGNTERSGEEESFEEHCSDPTGREVDLDMKSNEEAGPSKWKRIMKKQSDWQYTMSENIPAIHPFNAYIGVS